jgi:hypothetical protein
VQFSSIELRTLVATHLASGLVDHVAPDSLSARRCRLGERRPFLEADLPMPIAHRTVSLYRIAAIEQPQ